MNLNLALRFRLAMNLLSIKSGNHIVIGGNKLFPTGYGLFDVCCVVYVRLKLNVI